MKQLLRKAFGRYLIMTNTVTGAAFMGMSDVMVQYLESTPQTRKINLKRTGHMAFMGGLIGLFGHAWYTALDKHFPGTTLKIITKKILLDQLIFSPLYMYPFFIGVGTLDGQTVSACHEEFKSKFWTIYKAEWCIWPAAQAINFYYLHPRYRILYISGITIGWDAFLSHMKYEVSDGPKHTEEKAEDQVTR